MYFLKGESSLKGFKVFGACSLIGFLIMLPYIIQSKGFFTLVSDYNYQQIPFNMYCIEAIKNGNVLWDWNTDLGGNFVGNYAFYTLGSPFFWLLSLFPSKMVPYLLGPVLALKYGVAGLTSFWYLRRYTNNERFAFVGAVLYSFSGFQAGNTIFNHFHDAVAFFPLLLIGLDKLVEENKKGIFALAVALNAITNYFFFAGEVIFLGIYYFIKIVWDNKNKIRTIGYCLLEGLMGVGISCAIFYPALIFTLRNPRVASHIPVSSYFLFDIKQYIRLLKAILLPMEAMTSNSSVEAHVYSSTSLYLPMIGIFLVICFFMADRKKENKWIKRTILVCALVALIPVLNSSFYAFNADYDYYTRWFYMPILLLALASIKVLETEKEHLKNELILNALLFLLLIILLLNPFGQGDYLLHKFRVFILFAISICGLAITIWLLIRKRKGKPYIIFLVAGVVIFAIITNSYVMLVMRDTAPVIHYTDGVKAFHEAANEIEIPDEKEDWRVMFSNQKKNMPLLMNVPSVNSWNSTVSGEIFKFYSLIGGNREFDSPSFGISSEPGKALLSVKYEILSTEELQRWEGEDKKKELIAEYDTKPFEVYVYEKGFGLGDYKQYTNQFKFYLFRNENFLPIGFTYDSYITENELLKIPKEERLYAMLRAVVLSEEDGQKMKDYVRHIEKDELSNLDEGHMKKDIEERREAASSEFTHNTNSINSVITTERNGMAFFSVPYDYSWIAYVNGKKVPISNAGGMMCIPVEKGENDIVFKYLAIDNLIGGILTGISMIIFIGYLVFCKRGIKIEKKDCIS